MDGVLSILRTEAAAAWAAAIGTVGAFVITYRLMRSEVQDRRQAQAEGLAVWRAARTLGTNATVHIGIANSSNGPIYDLVIAVRPHGETHLALGAMVKLVVPPGYRMPPDDLDYGLAHNVSIRGAKEHLEAEDVHFDLTFRDASGRYWIRQGDSPLVEIKRRVHERNRKFVLDAFSGSLRA